MGADKRFLPVEGKSLLSRAVDLARRFTGEVFLSANDPERLVEFGLPVVPDRLAGGGPVTGIHAGLLVVPCDLVLVLPCDAPSVSEALVGRLQEEAAGFDVTCGSTPGGIEPLVGFYRRRCAGAIEAAVAQGRRRVTDFFPSVRARVLSPQETALVDPQGRSFVNWNEPSDLEPIGEGVR